MNEYLRTVAGADFTAKDFRTWAATTLAAEFLLKKRCGSTARMRRRQTVEAVHHVAKRLHNAPAACRKYYVHPRILEAFEDRSLHVSKWKGKVDRRLTRTEQRVVEVLRSA